MTITLRDTLSYWHVAGASASTTIARYVFATIKGYDNGCTFNSLVRPANRDLTALSRPRRRWRFETRQVGIGMGKRTPPSTIDRHETKRQTAQNNQYGSTNIGGACQPVTRLAKRVAAG